MVYPRTHDLFLGVHGCVIGVPIHSYVLIGLWQLGVSCYLVQANAPAEQFQEVAR